MLSVEGKLFATEDTGLLSEDEKPASGVEIEMEKRRVTVHLDIIIAFEKDLYQVFRDIKRTVSEEVQRMTNLEVTEVNVHVADIVTQEAYEKALLDQKTKDNEKS